MTGLSKGWGWEGMRLSPMGLSGGAYRGLRVYVPLRSKLQPERMANQRKELSSIAYTWGRGRQHPQLPERGMPPPKEVMGLQRIPSRLC